MYRPSLTALSLLLLAAAPLSSQSMNHDPDKKAEGGALPAGWTGRTDRDNTKLADAKFVTMGTGFHVTSGPAAIYWKPTNMMTGRYVASASFTQMKAPTHPEAYGIFFMGKNLNAPGQSYAYMLVRGDGKVLVKHRAGKDVHTVMDWTDNAAVVKQDASGKATNTLSVDASRPDSVRLLVNGKQITAMADGYMGGAKGFVGLRVNHNLDVHIADLTVTSKGMAAKAPARQKVRKAMKKAASQE